MKSRKPILYLAIVFALVCVYQLSFTWKVSNVDKEKESYAISQFEINRTNDINNINSENIANNLRMNLINIDFIDSLQKNNINYLNKKILLELDSSYFQLNKTDNKLIVNDTNIIKKYQTNLDSFIIYNISDIFIDSSEIRKVSEVKRSEMESNYNTNRISILKDLESEYIDLISFDTTGKEIGVFNLLLKNYTYQECKDRQLNLGLDLKGGISVTLEVDIRDVLENYSNKEKKVKESENYLEFLSKLDNADEKMKSGSEGYLDLFYQEYSDVLDEKSNLSYIFSSRDFDGEMNGLSNKEVLDKLREKIEGESGIISTTFTTLKERSERFANIRPNILTTSVSGRFIVELPGADDVNRVNSILTDPAKLEFLEAYKLNEIFDITQSSINFKGVSETDFSMSEWFTTVQMFKQNGEFLFQPQDGEFGPVIGYSNISNIEGIENTLQLLFDKIEKVHPDVEFSYGYLSSDKTRNTLQIYALKKDKGTLLSGDIISNSGASLQNGKWEVSMSMKPDASNKWSKITEENIGNYVAIVLDGKVKSCPIINTKIDGGRSVISGEFSSSEAKDLSNILGSGKLKSKLNILQQSVVGPSLGQASIDASMKSFLIALFIVFLYMIFYYYSAGIVSNVALIANLFFIFGVLASTGLVLTLPGIAGIVLTIGMSVDANVLIYERIREELTNGKGIRLAIEDGYKSAYTSIIDANVTTLLTGIILYIFGSGPIKGFATTLIIGILTSLFCAIFITRLIISARLNKGKSISFSTKLTKGAFKNLNIDFIGRRKIFYVVSSLIILFGVFSLIKPSSFLNHDTELGIFDEEFNLRFEDHNGNGIKDGEFPDEVDYFNGKLNLSLGIDFSGGRTYIVNFSDETITNEDIKESLSKVFVNEDGSAQSLQVSKFNDLTEPDSLNQKIVAVNAVKIITKYMINSDDKNADSIVRSTLLNGLGSDFTEDNIVSYQKVASTIADDIRSSAWGSIIFSLLVIFLYILVRFKKWQFSLGAVVAVFHDVLIVLSVFSIFYGMLPFSLEIDQAFIAAILTIIGYSLNDTVVVFDRVREYMNDNKKKEVHELINQSLNSTLSRTINTSLTTFFVLLIIFLFGGEVIKGFMFALMVGVVVGTYSSLFVASPIMLDTIKRKELKIK